MRFDREDYLSSQEVKEFIEFFENGITINANNRSKYSKEEKLSKAIEIYESDKIELRKLYEIANLFKDSKSLRKAFHKISRYEEDEFLNSYCKKINEIANFLEVREKSGQVEIAKELVEKEHYFENHYLATYYIEKYRESDYMFLGDFLKEEGLNEEEFNYLVNIAYFLDPYLEIIYNEKKNEMLRERKYNTRKSFEAMYDGIVTGKTREGRPFDELECMNLFPFKTQKNLEELLVDFEARNDCLYYRKVKNLLYKVLPQKADTIFDYMMEKNILPQKESLLTEKEIRSSRYIVGDREVTADEKDVIIRYMNVMHTPYHPKAFSLVRDKVLEGKLFYDKEEKVLKMKK